MAEGSSNGWPKTVVGPHSHREEARIEQPTEITFEYVAGDTQGQIGEGLVLLRCWRYLEVCVMLEGQVPMPYTFTAGRTLLAQASPVPYSERAWGPTRASKQCHLVHARGMQWRRTGGASSVGRCHELECLDDDALGKGSLQCRLAS